MEKSDEKIYTVDFELNAKLLAILYICYKYNFPLQFLLSFYELYGDASLFALKALSCYKKLALTDNDMVKILEESRRLFLQIQKRVTIKNKIKEIERQGGNYDKPELPKLDLICFSVPYSQFIENYLLKNVEDLYSVPIRLRMSSGDLYQEIL